MKKLLLFTVLVVAANVSAAVILNMLDNIVHGTLYNYGLRFSPDWANPYWTLLRVVQALMVATAVFALVNLIYVYRKYISIRPQMPHVSQTKSEKVERKIIPSPVREPEPASEAQRVGGLVKCPHCQRVFSQPLRMLDFHSERPRIINICPFCNEVIPPILRNEETEKLKRFVLRGKKDGQSRESQRGEETQETVATS
jgi:hypothetical protein